MVFCCLDDVVDVLFDSDVHDVVAVIGQNDVHQVFTNVVDIAPDRGKNHRSLTGFSGLFHVGLQQSNRSFHHLG